MNIVHQDLNNLLKRKEIPCVYSLHDPEGRVVAAFASNDAQTVASTFADWVRHLEQGCVAIMWMYGAPNTSYGKETL